MTLLPTILLATAMPLSVAALAFGWLALITIGG